MQSKSFIKLFSLGIVFFTLIILSCDLTEDNKNNNNNNNNNNIDDNFAPQGLTSNNKTINSISFTWQSVEGIGKYYIYRSDTMKGVYKKIGYSETDIYTDKKRSDKEQELKNNMGYYYRVSSSDLGENISEGDNTVDPKKCSDYLIAYTALKLPDYFVVSDKVAGSAILQWVSVVGATRYVLYRTSMLGKVHVPVYELKVSAADSNKADEIYQYTDFDLIDGRNYYYQLKCFNDNTDSNDTLNLAVIMDISVPDNVLCYFGETELQIVITWNKVEIEGLTGYKIYKSYDVNGPYVEIGTAKASESGYYYNVDSKTERGELLYFKIASVSSGGESNQSNFAEIAIKPNPPTLFPGLSKIVKSFTEKSVILKWKNPSKGMGNVKGKGILITKFVDGVETNVKKIVGLDQQDYKIDSLTSDTKYEYRVYAYVERKFSAPGSDPIVRSDFLATGGEVITFPQGVEINSPIHEYTDKVRLTWSESKDAKEYRIYCKDNSVTPGKYEYAGSSNGLSFTHKELKALTNYSYYVEVQGKFSKVKSPIIPCTTRPPAPEGLKVSGQTTTSVKLTWLEAPGITDKTTYKDSYIIKTASGLNKIVERKDAKVTGKQWEYEVTRLDPNTLYNFEVYTRFTENATGKILDSTIAAEVASYTCPSAPRIMSAAADGNNIKIKVEGQTKSYIVYLYSGAGFTTEESKYLDADKNNEIIYTNAKCFTNYKVKVVCRTVIKSGDPAGLTVLASDKSEFYTLLKATTASWGTLNASGVVQGATPPNYIVTLTWEGLNGISNYMVKRTNNISGKSKTFGGSSGKKDSITLISPTSPVRLTYILYAVNPNDKNELKEIGKKEVSSN